MKTPRLIFICGLHKSGTSLLHEIMRSHPQISGFRNTGAVMDEGQFLQTVFPPAYIFGGQGRFGFHKEMHMTETHPDAHKETAVRLFNEWSEYWDLSLPLLVEKSPPNILRMRFLQALFPESKFLIILRHPIAVAEATAKTAKISITKLVEHTLHCYEIMREDLNCIQNYYILRYEDLCTNPLRTIEEVYNWLGIEEYSYKRQIVNDVNRDYFNTWRKRKAAGFFRPISRRKEEDYENRMSFFGYSLLNLEEMKRTSL